MPCQLIAQDSIRQDIGPLKAGHHLDHVEKAIRCPHPHRLQSAVQLTHVRAGLKNGRSVPKGTCKTFNSIKDRRSPFRMRAKPRKPMTPSSASTAPKCWDFKRASTQELNGSLRRLEVLRDRIVALLLLLCCQSRSFKERWFYCHFTVKPCNASIFL
jgi:hypothetical protein